MKNFKFYLAILLLVVSGIVSALKYLPESVNIKTILTVVDLAIYATGVIMFISSDKLKDKNILIKILLMLGINLFAFVLTETAISYF